MFQSLIIHQILQIMIIIVHYGVSSIAINSSYFIFLLQLNKNKFNYQTLLIICLQVWVIAGNHSNIIRITIIF